MPSSPLIDSINAGLPGASPTAVSLCYAAADNGGTPVLDPAKVTGKIVVCDRGTNSRTNKSLAVAEAGGVGMILVNTSLNTLNADVHLVPTVHLAHTDRPAIKAYAAVDGTAAIQQARITSDVPAPLTASFSSRGPLVAGGGDLLKPDLIAPGQDILAAVAPPGNAGLSFSLYSGTSMSSPHVAGLAALLKHLHQDWSPMMIKSALMTTGSDLLDGDNTDPAAIFRQGAGHVTPNKAADPGLLFDSTLDDWLAFLCGTTNGVNPASCATLERDGYSLDPSDLNTPSIAIGDLAGVQTVTRRVTNPGIRRATYTASYTGMAGFEVEVTPPTLTIGPGKAKAFTVSFKRTGAAPANAYTGGQLVLSDNTHTVRLPMVVRPVSLATTTQVYSQGEPVTYTVGFGYDGPFSATPRGLMASTDDPGEVADDPTDTFSPTGPGIASFTVSIPEGTTHARFALFEDQVSQAADLDLYVYRGTTLVGGSLNGGSDEQADLEDPAPGLYTVYVHGFEVPAAGVSFTLVNWLLPDADAGNMTVAAPAAAVAGAVESVTLTFDPALPSGRYLGSVVYGGEESLPEPTIVRVDVP